MLARIKGASVVGLVSVVGLAGLSACSHSKHSSSSQSATAATTTTSAGATTTTAPSAATSTTAAPLAITSTHNLNAPAATSAGTLVVLSYESPAAASSSSTKPPAGKQFALINVKSCAGSTAARSVAPADFRLQLADGGIVTPRVAIRDPALVEQQLKPGACETGYVTFAIPTGAKATTVVDTGSGAAWQLS